jgi:hypothetical protein
MPHSGSKIVSDQRSNRADLPTCAWCGAHLAEAFTVAPNLHEPALIVYECPQSGHVHSAAVP